MGIVNLAIVYIILKTTGIGIYAIAGVSSVLVLTRIIFFVPIYSAHILNQKWWVFYIPLIRGIITSAIVGTIFIAVSLAVDINSWMMLIIVSGVMGIIGYLIGFATLFSKQEKFRLLEIVKSKLRRKTV